MKFVTLSAEHIPAAAQLAADAYEAERRVVPALPEAALPPLAPFVDFGMGVAAVEDGVLLGFLAAYPPFFPAFSTNATGAHSPAHAHGVLPGQEARVWPRLYQAAAEHWVRAGCGCHSITLYAHDRAAQEVLSRYGFGIRCMDAVRSLTSIDAVPVDGFRFDWWSDWDAAVPLRRALAQHLGQSPCFLPTSEADFQRWDARSRTDGRRMFAAQRDGRLIAYIEVNDDGEHYATETEGMMNICGAYCLPAFRSQGLMPALLDALIAALAAEGHTCLGVDFESFNPTAYGFWRKHFSIYTHSVVRRIDEQALTNS